MARYRAVVAAGLRAADHVVAPTEAMMMALQRHHGPLARRSVIANGRDPARFRPAAKQPFVLTAGRLWDRAKNIDSVAAIAARLSWPVVAAGDAGRLEVGIGTPTFPIRYIGCLSQTDLAEWLGHASIFALPARYEPFGLLPLEAALSGCALVLGDIASLREVWGEAARYVDCNDPEHLRMEIQQLIADAATRHEMADRARRRALAFTAARMGDAYTELYRNLARTRGAVGAGAAVVRPEMAETS
jgi:glycosyltransferase involved in cell wall biosynthesis